MPTTLQSSRTIEIHKTVQSKTTTALTTFSLAKKNRQLKFIFNQGPPPPTYVPEPPPFICKSSTKEEEPPSPTYVPGHPPSKFNSLLSLLEKVTVTSKKTFEKEENSIYFAPGIVDSKIKKLFNKKKTLENPIYAKHENTNSLDKFHNYSGGILILTAPKQSGGNMSYNALTEQYFSSSQRLALNTFLKN